MAEGKKSFIAYSDWKNMFDEMPDEDAGKLIKHIFAYVNDENPESDSVLIKAVFANIKATLKRDLQKWDKQLKQRSEAGKISALNRSTKSNERSTVVNETVRNPTDSVSVSVSVNEKQYGSDLNFEFIDNRFSVCFFDWIKFRKEIKDPILHQAVLEKCYTELVTLSKNDSKLAEKIVEQSMNKGWKHLYELQKDTSKRQTTGLQGLL